MGNIPAPSAKVADGVHTGLLVVFGVAFLGHVHHGRGRDDGVEEQAEHDDGNVEIFEHEIMLHLARR